MSKSGERREFPRSRKSLTRRNCTLFRWQEPAIDLLVRNPIRWPKSPERPLFAGTNPRAEAFDRTIDSSPELGYQLLWFADEAWGGTGILERTAGQLSLAWAISPSFLRKHIVDEVVIAASYEVVFTPRQENSACTGFEPWSRVPRRSSWISKS
jgi:hypothetical protein